MVFYVKLFTPDSNWTWYIAEYDPETEIAWGLVKGHEQEFGSFDMKEIKKRRGPFGLPVERDICFDPIKEKELLLFETSECPICLENLLSDQKLVTMKCKCNYF